MSRWSGRVGLISNRHSGHNRDQFERLRGRIDHSRHIEHRVTESAADIPAVIADLAERDIRVLAINGGDGTAAAILGCLLEQHCFETPPLIALLPGGTANMSAGDTGIRGTLGSALKRFCLWCEGERDSTGKLQQRALLRVQATGASATQYGMFLGAGAVIQGTEYAHRALHARGLRDDFSLALGTARTLWGMLRNDPAFRQPVAIELSLDQGPGRHHNTLILAISTLQRLAFGMRPFWGTGAGPIRLTLMEQHCSRLARTFISIACGRPNRNAVPAQGYISHNADRIGLSLQASLNLDGEIIPVNGAVSVTASTPLAFLRL